MRGRTAVQKNHREGEYGNDQQVAGDGLPEHMHHHQHHDYRGGHRGNPEALDRLPQITLCYLGIGFRISVLCEVDSRDIVTGIFDRLAQGVGLDLLGILDGNAHAMVADIRLHPLHAGNAAQRGCNDAGTVITAHARHRQIDRRVTFIVPAIVRVTHQRSIRSVMGLVAGLIGGL